MNEISFKLSICIPTFNRADQLDKTLSRVVESIKVLGDDSLTEVLIGDNASEDCTRDVGFQYSEKYSNFKYIRNPSNLGTEKNWLNLISKARGDYVWILSDDDDFNVQIVSEIIRIVNDFHPALIFLNYQEFNESTPGSSRCKIKSNVSGVGWQDFFNLGKLANSFVSSNIFRRNAFIPLMPTLDAYIESPWFQLYVSRHILGDNQMFYIVSKPLLEMRGLSLLDGRREQHQRGRKHFYFNVHLAFLLFLYDLNIQRDPYFFALARSNLHQQILYEKYTWSQLDGSQDYSYWLGVIRRLLSVDIYSGWVRLYLIEIPLILLPGCFSAWVLEVQKIRLICGTWIRNGESSDGKMQKSIFYLYRKLKKSLDLP